MTQIGASVDAYPAIEDHGPIGDLPAAPLVTGDGVVSDSLVYRDDPGASPDGPRGAEGTLTMCSFWYVEEIAPGGEQVGNFPQAFSHLALIDAAVNLDRQLDGGR